MARKKPGPKARRRNPSPVVDEGNAGGSAGSPPDPAPIVWVIAEQIDAAERALRQRIKGHRRELKPHVGETMAAATARIAQLILEIAEENTVESLSWTTRLDRDSEPFDVERLYPMIHEADGTWTCRYLGPGPRHGEARRHRITSRREQRQESTGEWVPTDTLEWFIEEYDLDSKSWKPLRVPAKSAEDAEEWLIGDGRKTFGLARPTPWRLVPAREITAGLREPVRRMLRRQMGKAGRDGRYAYLAYSVLGTLLDLTPLKIRTLLDNFRRPRHRSKA